MSPVKKKKKVTCSIPSSSSVVPWSSFSSSEKEKKTVKKKKRKKNVNPQKNKFKSTKAEVPNARDLKVVSIGTFPLFNLGKGP